VKERCKVVGVYNAYDNNYNGMDGLAHCYLRGIYTDYGIVEFVNGMPCGHDLPWLQKGFQNHGRGQLVKVPVEEILMQDWEEEER